MTEPHPSWCTCRSCLKAEEAEERAALHELSCVDDDPAVEAELSRGPGRVGDDLDWVEWAKSKLDPYEQAGVDPPA